MKLTRDQIIQIGLKFGLPEDYPLRGGRKKVAHQIYMFFQRTYEYTAIATNSIGQDYEERKLLRDQVKEALKEWLSTDEEYLNSSKSKFTPVRPL